MGGSTWWCPLRGRPHRRRRTSCRCSRRSSTTSHAVSPPGSTGVRSAHGRRPAVVPPAVDGQLRRMAHPLAGGRLGRPPRPRRSSRVVRSGPRFHSSRSCSTPRASGAPKPGCRRAASIAGRHGPRRHQRGPGGGDQRARLLTSPELDGVLRHHRPPRGAHRSGRTRGRHLAGTRADERMSASSTSTRALRVAAHEPPCDRCAARTGPSVPAGPTPTRRVGVDRLPPAGS